MAIVMEIKDFVDGEDIDEYGHVNYKAVPKMLEGPQDVFMIAHVMSFAEIEERYGLRTVVRTMTVDYHGEMLEGDAIRVDTWISKFGITSITYQQAIFNGDVVIISYQMVVVLINADGKKAQIPDELRELLEKLV